MLAVPGRLVWLRVGNTKSLAKIDKRRLRGTLGHSAGASASARSIASFMGIEDTPGASAARNSMLPAGPRSGDAVSPVILTAAL